jgi:hypothetical protein
MAIVIGWLHVKEIRDQWVQQDHRDRVDLKVYG